MRRILTYVSMEFLAEYLLLRTAALRLEEVQDLRAQRRAARAARKAFAIKRTAERAAAECEKGFLRLWGDAKLVARAGLLTDEQVMQAWTGRPRRPVIEVKGFWLEGAPHVRLHVQAEIKTEIEPSSPGELAAWGKYGRLL